MEKISILTSVYNKAPWLTHFFETVISQTYKDLDIVVVDNASTDESSSIISRFAEADNRIRVVTLKQNLGPAGGITTAINNISGDYFTILDADDFIENNYVEALYNALKETDSDVAMCVNDMVWENGDTKRKPWPKDNLNVIDGIKAELLPCQLLDELSDKYFGFHMPEIGAEWCKLYKTSIIKENNLTYDLDLWKWCDWVFNFTVMTNVKRMVYIRNTTYHFMQSDNSATRSKSFSPKFLDYLFTAVDRMYSKCKDMNDPRIMKAFNIFCNNRIREIVTYILNAYPEQSNKMDLLSALNRIGKMEAFQMFFKTNDSYISFKNRVFLFAVKHKLISIILLNNLRSSK